MSKKKSWSEKSLEFQENIEKHVVNYIKTHGRAKITVILVLLFVSLIGLVYVLDTMYLFYISFPNFFTIDSIGLYFKMVISFALFYLPYKWLSGINKKFSNPFIILSIVILISLIYFGYVAVLTIFPSHVFPNVSFSPNEDISGLISCKSSSEREVPTVSDYMWCKVTITNNDNDTIHIKEIRKYDNFLATPNYTNPAFPCTMIIPPNATEYCDTSFRVGEAGTHEYQFSVSLYKETEDKSVSVGSYYSKYTSFSEDGYFERITQKYSLLVTIIIGALFSTFIAVRNLMAIWEKRSG